MWATLTDADSYLLGKVGGEAWSSLTDDQRERALITAYRALVNDPMYSYPAEVTPRMRDAQIELAFYLTTSSGDQSVTMQQAGVESFTIGTFSQTYKADADIVGERQTYPQEVINLLSPYRAHLQALVYVTRRKTR